MTSSLTAAAHSTVVPAEPSDDNLFAPTNKPLHFVILVHGWMGNDLELGFLESTLRAHATADDTNHPDENHQFVVHSAKDNVGRTNDGIAAGGTRLADEVTRQVQSYLSTSRNSGNRTEPPLVTLSFVGNSLGGLYARYALSKLDFDYIHPLVFCTTATPHLGVSKNTYIPLPRVGEWAVSRVMQPTGRDLFCFSSVVRDLALEPQFTQPLQSFVKRIAYANAFGTDFQVPTATAAFLSKTSTYPHYGIDADDKSTAFALTVETRSGPAGSCNNVDSGNDLSQALDAIGWTKVFCDARNNIPLPSIPIPFLTRAEPSTDKSEWTSQELYETMTGMKNRWYIPLGHTVMVANSKNDWYSRVNEKGRPFMDQLALDMIHDIRKYANDILEERGSQHDGV